MTFLITGGAGFIGSAVIRYLLQHTEHQVVNLDKLTYAGNLESLSGVIGNSRYSFELADVADRAAVDRILAKHNPEVIMHLAAESHVDRSIDGPDDFIQTNIIGTYVLLQSSRAYWSGLTGDKKANFRFHHVSSDEVFGDLGFSEGLFTESSPYAPSSPYSASKAASDHLVRAWWRTYALPVVLSNSSNNYGRYQFPEKLIPHMILNALQGKQLPVYGNGEQVRDWLYVDDHARALVAVATAGRIGESYNVGGQGQRRNLSVVEMLCDLLEELAPHRKAPGLSNYRDLITFVTDRVGHDIRYAIDSRKIERELGWKPQEAFESGLRKTVQWYLDHEDWWQRVLSGVYRLERIGL